MVFHLSQIQQLVALLNLAWQLLVKGTPKIADLVLVITISLLCEFSALLHIVVDGLIPATIGLLQIFVVFVFKICNTLMIVIIHAIECIFFPLSTEHRSFLLKVISLNIVSFLLTPQHTFLQYFIVNLKLFCGCYIVLIVHGLKLQKTQSSTIILFYYHFFVFQIMSLSEEEGLLLETKVVKIDKSTRFNLPKRKSVILSVNREVLEQYRSIQLTSSSGRRRISRQPVNSDRTNKLKKLWNWEESINIYLQSTERKRVSFQGNEQVYGFHKLDRHNQSRYNEQLKPFQKNGGKFSERNNISSAHYHSSILLKPSKGVEETQIHTLKLKNSQLKLQPQARILHQSSILKSLPQPLRLRPYFQGSRRLHRFLNHYLPKSKDKPSQSLFEKAVQSSILPLLVRTKTQP